MKTLFFTSAFNESQTGGSVEYYRNLVRGFEKCEMTVLTGSMDDSDFKKMEGNVQVVGKRRLWQAVTGLSRVKKSYLILWSITFLLRMARGYQWIIAGEILMTGIPAAIVTTMLNKRFCLFVLGEEISEVQWGGRSWRYGLYQWICKKADLLVTCSETTKNVLAEFGVPREKIVSVTPGVREEYLSQELSQSEEKRRLGLNGRKILLTVARVEKRKGHANVIRALPSIIKSIPNLTYVIVGDDFGEVPILRKMVVDLGIDDHVRFEGKVSKESLYSYYAACDCFIMASYVDNDVREMEGFGMVFLEANSLGKPVIGGRSGGTIEAIADGVSGLVVDATNREELEKAIMSILGDDEFAKHIGEAGRLRAEKDFRWQDRANRFRRALLEYLEE